MNTFLNLCKNTDTESKYWQKWLEENPDKKTSPNELLGIRPEEYEDLKQGIHSFDFYIFKSNHEKYLYQLWSGCYIAFAFEIDKCNPHLEYGWVDIVSNEHGFCKVQCDDSYNGNRALTIRISDVMEILPFKERPLIYYKTMLCGDCNDCDRISIELPPETCQIREFFDAIINKQKSDAEFIRLYKMIDEKNKSADNHQCNCDHCNHCNEKDK